MRLLSCWAGAGGGGYDWTQEMRRHRFLVGPPVAARPTAQAPAVGQ